jgi:pyruvate formate lyase activating enzyme
MLKKLVSEKLVDYVAMDIKAPLTWEKYRKVACIDNMKLFENVLESVKLLKGSKIDYEFRTTVVPGMHKEKDILEIADQIKGAKMYALQQFTPKETTLDPEFANLKPYPDAFITGIKDRISGHFGTCEVRNNSE